MDNKSKIFQQDLSEQTHPGTVFLIQLLMKKAVELPEKEPMNAIMQKHLGNVECFWHDEKGAGFAAKKYLAEFKDAAVPPQLMITACSPFDGASLDEFQKSQMWDCMEDRDRILEECHYQILATDMLAAVLPAKDRAELDMDYMEALIDLFPECVAVYFQNSGKMFTADKIRNKQIPREDRFIYYAVNVRFFNIENTNDMLVDTIGMSTLFLPDIQYHFHDYDPNQVVEHAYNIASYLLDQDNPIDDGDTVDAIVNGRMDQEIQWACHYEEALIQPAREVIDIHMGESASGCREQD